MPCENDSGAFYRRKLPHIRAPGSVYHVRVSVDPSRGQLKATWMFESVESSLLFAHKKTNLLHGYVIMPNHVHLIIQPLPKTAEWAAWCDYRRFHRLEEIIRRFKSYTARQINSRVLTRGSFWREEYFDRIVRGSLDLEAVIDYVHHNPVRWGLVQRPKEYRWSSLNTIYSGDKRFAGWFDLAS